MKKNVRRVLLCFSSFLLLCMTALCLSFSVSAADGEPTAAEMIPVTVDMRGKGEKEDRGRFLVFTCHSHSGI